MEDETYFSLFHLLSYLSILQTNTYLRLIWMSQGALKLLQILRPIENFEEEIKTIEEDFKRRDEQVKKNCQQTYNIDLDRVRKKQGFYVKFMNKKQEPFPEDSIKVYLQTSLELQKNKSSCLFQHKKLYVNQLKKTHQALVEISKQYREFAENKKNEVTYLTATVKDLRSRLDDLEKKYKLIGEEQVTNVVEKDTDAKMSGIGVVPYICLKMDQLLASKINDLNFSERELTEFKKFKNDVLGKFSYTISLLKRKENEKDYLDMEADLEMDYHKLEIEQYKKQTLQAQKKEKEALQLIEITKKELMRNVDFLYRQKKKYDSYPGQINELNRTIKKLQNDKRKLRSEIYDLERKIKKTLGERVEARGNVPPNNPNALPPAIKEQKEQDEASENGDKKANKKVEKAEKEEKGEKGEKGEVAQ